MTAIFSDGDLVARAMTEADIPLVAGWLTDPRVLEFYEGRDNPQDEAKVRADFEDDDGCTRCIVELSGVPIGYIQLCDLAGWLDVYGLDERERVWGIDQFIGDPAMWGRGIGRRLVRAAAEYLLVSGRASRVITDPEAWNERAVRSYEAAGFVKVRLLPQHERHEGEMRDCWLMEYRRAV